MEGECGVVVHHHIGKQRGANISEADLREVGW
jgi:hypothetical protein